jgi:hypothetical protein
MAKKAGEITNIRVQVYPDNSWGIYSPSDLLDTCKQIQRAIKRHVDDFGTTEVVYDRTHVCEHCGSTWTEDSATYNGGCCDKDEEANPHPEAA